MFTLMILNLYVSLVFKPKVRERTRALLTRQIPELAPSQIRTNDPIGKRELVPCPPSRSLPPRCSRVCIRESDNMALFRRRAMRVRLLSSPTARRPPHRRRPPLSRALKRNRNRSSHRVR